MSKSTITFHYNTSPAVPGVNTIHILFDVIFCCSRPVSEFNCTFTYIPGTPPLLRQHRHLHRLQDLHLSQELVLHRSRARSLYVVGTPALRRPDSAARVPTNRKQLKLSCEQHRTPTRDRFDSGLRRTFPCSRPCLCGNGRAFRRSDLEPRRCRIETASARGNRPRFR